MPASGTYADLGRVEEALTKINQRLLGKATTVRVNGTDHTPVDGVIDLGTLSSGGSGTAVPTTLYSTAFDTNDGGWQGAPTFGTGVLTAAVVNDSVYRTIDTGWAVGDKMRVAFTADGGSTGGWEPILACIDSTWSVWPPIPDMSPDGSLMQTASTTYTFTIPTGTAHLQIGWKSIAGSSTMTALSVENLTQTTSSGTTTTTGDTTTSSDSGVTAADLTR